MVTSAGGPLRRPLPGRPGAQRLLGQLPEVESAPGGRMILPPRRPVGRGYQMQHRPGAPLRQATSPNWSFAPPQSKDIDRAVRELVRIKPQREQVSARRWENTGAQRDLEMDNHTHR